jgi:hypothetical protein
MIPRAAAVDAGLRHRDFRAGNAILAWRRAHLSLPIASNLFECEHFANTQLERIGYLLQTLGRHAAVLCSFIALYLLFGQGQPFGEFLLRKIANDTRLNQRLANSIMDSAVSVATSPRRKTS